jgi:hypothetical protein
MTQRDSIKLIGDARDHLARHFSAGVVKSLPALTDRLTQAAAKLTERDRRLVMGARDLIMQREADWQKQMASDYRQRFDEKLAGAESGFANTVTFSLDSLTLMDEAEMQETILLGNLSSQLKEACNLELFALTRRMEHLTERDLLSDSANPLLPRSFCRAMLSGLSVLDASAVARYHILAAADPLLASILHLAYKDANEFLISHAVLIEIPQSYGRGAKKPAARKGLSGGAPSGASSTAAGGEAPASPALGMIAQLLAQQGALPPATAPVPPVMASGTTGAPTSGGVNAARAAFATTGASAASTTATIAAPSAAPGANALLPPIDPALMEALNQIAALGMMDAKGGVATPASSSPADAAPDNVLRYARNLLTPALQPAQSVMTDVVTAFFDRLFAAPEMSPAIKSLLGRLQVQTLKAAILNPAVLGDESHPLREFMDKLADLGVKRRHSLRPGEAIYAQLSDIVDGLCTHFDTDPDAVSNANVELDVLLETEEAHAMEALNESVAKLQEAEHAEMARALAAYDVATRLQAGKYPLAIRAFASKYWQPLLAMDHLTLGEESEQRQRDLTTLDDLLWSVGPIHTADDKQRLLKLIPSLAAHLNDGLDRAGISSAERGGFFQFLADCHMLALRPAPLSRVRKDIAEAVPAGADTIALAAVDPRSRLRKRTVDIERGQWIDWRMEDGTHQRCRLSWVSPLMESLVFKNYDNNQALTLTPAEFNAKLRAGDIKLVADSSLMQRSVDEAIKGLMAPPR